MLWTLSGPLNLYWINESVVAVVVVVVCRFFNIFSSLKFSYSNEMFDGDFCWLLSGLNELTKPPSPWRSKPIQNGFLICFIVTTNWLNSTPMFSWTSNIFSPYFSIHRFFAVSFVCRLTVMYQWTQWSLDHSNCSNTTAYCILYLFWMCHYFLQSIS